MTPPRNRKSVAGNPPPTVRAPVLDPTKQGREVYVEGWLRIRDYEAKDNGGKRQRAEIIASRVQFLGGRPANAKEATEVNGDPASDEVPFSGCAAECPRFHRAGIFAAPRAVS